MLLDDITGAAAAFSMRQIRTAYAGNCLKVRRSSDSTTLDIGFSGGWLDESALLTFCGGGDGFIDTWYDQSTAGVNATQATTTLQPRIVSSGVVTTMPPTKAGATARPCIEVGYSGVKWLECTTGVAAGAGNALLSAIGLRSGAFTGAGGYMLILSASYSSVVGGFLLMAESSANAYSVWTDRGNNNLQPLEMGIQSCWQVSMYSTIYRSRKDGATLLTGTHAAYTITPTKLLIGAWNNAGFNGRFGEVVYFNDDKSADETLIAGNQCEAFGVDIALAAASGGGLMKIGQGGGYNG